MNMRALYLIKWICSVSLKEMVTSVISEDVIAKIIGNILWYFLLLTFSGGSPTFQKSVRFFNSFCIYHVNHN